MTCVDAQSAAKRARSEAEEEAAEEEVLAKRKPGVYSDTNGMPRAAGRVTHLGLADGELASRVVVVGHLPRAELLASFLDSEEGAGKPLFQLTSDRGFTTFTGRFEGARISVVAIGMGLTMMDFFVREARAVVKGPMAVVRFGTCGVLQQAVEVGTITLATEGSILVQRNYEAFGETGDGAPGKLEPYSISKPCIGDVELTAAVGKAMEEELGATAVVRGLNATADSFYSTQGRIDPCFPDANEGVVAEVLRQFPSIVSMEMETYMLFHLARCCRPAGSIRAAAAAVNVANRPTGAVVDGDRLKAMERDGGKAILAALARFAM